MIIELLGITDHFALFGDSKGLTVTVDTASLDVYDPLPSPAVNFAAWGEPDPAQVPAEAYELAESALGSTQRITGTDVIVAAAAADKRSFAIPKLVQDAAQQALRQQDEQYRDVSDVGMSTARTLAKGGSIGISKVRHLNRFHVKSKDSRANLDQLNEDDPFRVAHNLWGGDAGARWAANIVRRSDALSTRTRTAALAAAAEGDPAPDSAPIPLLPPADAAAETAEDAVEELDDTELSQDPDDLDGLVWNAEDLHPFMPSADTEEMCEVCGSTEYALAHSDDAADPVLTAALRQNIQQDTNPRVLTADGLAKVVRLHPRAAFFTQVNDEGEVIALFARSEGGWRAWDSDDHFWVDTAEQALSDVVPVDDESAVSFADSLILGVHAKLALDPVEAEMFDQAGDLPSVEPTALEEVSFATSLDPQTEEVDGLYIVTDEAVCYAWSASALVDWQELDECPTDTTLVDLDVARDIASQMAPNFAAEEIEEAFERAAYIDGVAQAPDGPVVAAPRAPYARRYPITSDNQYTPPRRSTITNRPKSGTSKSNAEEYTPEERSKNAAQQFRDAAGRFAKVGAIVHTEDNRTAEVTGVNPTNNTVRVRFNDGTVSDLSPDQLTKIGQATPAPKDADAPPPSSKIDFDKIQAQPRAVRGATPKAFLPNLLPPLGAPEIKTILSDYQKFIDTERKRKLKQFANLTPDSSDVKPLHLAIVDELDNSAVLDLISLVPATDGSNNITAFIRKDGGWVQDQALMRKISSTNPPALVTLDEPTYQTVLEQVDSFFEQQARAASAAPDEVLVSLWSEDGMLLPANLTTEDMGALLAAGGNSRAEATARLHRYWKSPGQPGYAKIRWNTPGDWTRCVRHLSKYVRDPKGMCQKWHKEVTGVYTGDRRNVGRRRGGGVRGDGSSLLLTVPSRIASAPYASDETTSTLVEVDIPTVGELANLRTRDYGHTLTPGEKFLVTAADGIYTIAVLNQDSVTGWEGLVASIVAPYGRPTALMILDQEL